MTPQLVVMASDSTTGWVIGYTIAIVVVLVVVALVVPILMLAHSIGNEATQINDSLRESVRQHRRAAGARDTRSTTPRSSWPGSSVGASRLGG